MDYRNKQSGFSPAIGARVSWEPLPKEYIDYLFGGQAASLKAAILNKYDKSSNKNNVWDEHGFFIYGSSHKLCVLATKREDRVKLKEIFFSYNVQRFISEQEEASDTDRVIKANENFVRRFSEVVTLCSISDHPASKPGWVKKYIGTKDTPPQYILESVYTQDTGIQAGVNLVSIPTTAPNPNLNINNPGVETVNERNAWKEPQVVNNYPFEGAAAAAGFLDVSDKKSDDRPVNKKDGKENLGADAISLVEGGALEFHPYPDIKGAAVKFGGELGRFDSYEEKRGHGTQQASFLAEGTMVNPNIISPSAFFYPNKGIIRNMFAPLSAVFDNPYLLLGLIALGAQNNKNKSHSATYIDLPAQVIDNQELKDELTNDGNI